MIPYLLFFSYFVFSFFAYQRIKEATRRKLIVFGALLVLILFSGFRNFMDISDIFCYNMAYNVVPTVGKFNFSTIHNEFFTYGFEKGFLFLLSILKTCGVSFRGFLFLHSVFFVICFYLGLRKFTEDFICVIFLFLYKIFFYNMFISMRQSITIAIFCLLINYIYEKKPIPYFIGCIIAMQFHTAAIILIPVYFCIYLKISRSWLILYAAVFIPTILLSVMHVPILNILNMLAGFFQNANIQEKIQNFVGDVKGEPLSIIHTLEYFLIYFLLILFYYQVVKENKKLELIIKIFLVLLPIFTLFRGYGMITRFKDYFTILYGVLLSYFHRSQIEHNRYLIFLFAIGWSLFGFVRYLLLFGGGKLLPYQTWIL